MKFYRISEFSKLLMSHWTYLLCVQTLCVEVNELSVI